MVFEIDFLEGIGIKKLTSPDLGRKIDSHSKTNVTHIGLAERSFLYLADATNKGDSYLFYEGAIYELATMYGLIKTKNGGFRSPKLASGTKEQKTVTRFIRNCVELKHNTSLRWYLIWFTVRNKIPFFILFDENSTIFKDLSKYGLFDPMCTDADKSEILFLNRFDGRYGPLMKYVASVINLNNSDQGEKSESAEISLKPDLKTAVASFDYDGLIFNPQQISVGKKDAEKVRFLSELLVEEYLTEMADAGNIQEYIWMNKDGNRFLPYDFKIICNSGEILYVKVKPTDGDFDEPIVFTVNEVKFIHSTQLYCIYRVFRRQGRFYLSSCSNPREHFSKLFKLIGDFKQFLGDLAKVQSMSLSIQPSVNKDLEFDEEIDFDFDRDIMLRICTDSESH